MTSAAVRDMPTLTMSSPSSASANVADDLVIRPEMSDLLKPREVEAALNELLQSFFVDKAYDPNTSPEQCREVAKLVKTKLKSFKLPRYKFLVQVMIGENRGNGIRCGTRCLWDAATDKLSQANFVNDTLFCVVAAFAVYLY